jgi:hypothetical protein
MYRCIADRIQARAVRRMGPCRCAYQLRQVAQLFCEHAGKVK